jgi:murein DD-endopeptidase MepM/ murein hydrolase activator NlpD
MTAACRVVAILASGLIVWSAAASRVAEQVRRPLAAVVPGAAVSQPFCCTALQLEPFDPFCPSRHVHTGIDLAAPAGSPVYSATAGRVRVGFDQRGAGLYVAVAYDDRVRVLYCHLSEALVVSGTNVAAGDMIGLVGSTGLATGPHVHFEVQVDGRSVDPVLWLASSANP